MVVTNSLPDCTLKKSFFYYQSYNFAIISKNIIKYRKYHKLSDSHFLKTPKDFYHKKMRHLFTVFGAKKNCKITSFIKASTKHFLLRYFQVFSIAFRKMSSCMECYSQAFYTDFPRFLSVNSHDLNRKHCRKCRNFT